MKPLEKPDAFHLSAAVGWLELGDWQEANDELERIAPPLRGHPTVLAVRWAIYSKAGKWDMAGDVAEILRNIKPNEAGWWLNLAYANRRRAGDGLNAAQKILVEAHKRFPKDPTIAYNLACYACQLGDLKGAWTLLEKAFEIGDAKKIKLMALDDPDLEPLWAEISDI